MASPVEAPSVSSVNPISFDALDIEAAVASAVATAVPYAKLAPSSHNSRPWRFEVDDGDVLLRADRSRSRPVGDPDGRELTISCGAALFNLRAALEHAGLDIVVSSLPDPGDRDLLARIRVRGMGAPQPGGLFEWIPQRRTDRRPFAARAVAPSAIAALESAAAAEGASLQVLGPRERRVVSELADDGDRRLHADPRWRREASQWMPPRAADERPLEPAPVLAVLATGGDGLMAWLAAGQALERVLLTAAREGLQASFINQPIQVPELRTRVAALLSPPGVAQIALRIGYPR
jgi:hypothetical protein